MHTPVTTCTPNADVADVRNLMKLKHCSAIPVVTIQDDEVQIEGIVTYHDLAGVYDDTVNVRQIMTQAVSAVHVHMDSKEAAVHMLEQDVHHLVVVNNGDLVGIISSLDFVKIVAEHEMAAV